MGVEAEEAPPAFEAPGDDARAKALTAAKAAVTE
jgi:hypothetical protein